MSQELKLENLHEYDQGALAVMFNQAVRQVYLDMDDRPLLKKARKVSIEFSFVPGSNAGDLDEIVTETKIKLAIPDKQSYVNILAPSKANGGSIMFDPDTRRTRTLPGQPTLEFEDEGNDE